MTTVSEAEIYKGFEIKPYARVVPGGYIAVATIARLSLPSEELHVEPPATVFRTVDAALFAASSWCHYMVDEMVKRLAH